MTQKVAFLSLTAINPRVVVTRDEDYSPQRNLPSLRSQNLTCSTGSLTSLQKRIWRFRQGSERDWEVRRTPSRGVGRSQQASKEYRGLTFKEEEPGSHRGTSLMSLVIMYSNYEDDGKQSMLRTRTSMLLTVKSNAFIAFSWFSKEGVVQSKAQMSSDTSVPLSNCFFGLQSFIPAHSKELRLTKGPQMQVRIGIFLKGSTERLERIYI